MKTLWTGATLAAIALFCGRLASAQVPIVSVTGGQVEGVPVHSAAGVSGHALSGSGAE
jgi:hypothetical protein